MVSAWNDRLVQKLDACGSLGLSLIQKCTAAFRRIADATDKYCCINESMAMELMKSFCKGVQAEFGSCYLRQLTWADFEVQLRINAARGFPSMFASLECMHYVLKNCTVALEGDYGDKCQVDHLIGDCSSNSLYLACFLRFPGLNNNINVLDCLPPVDNLLTNELNSMTFGVNGCEYNGYYLLVDGIYLQ